MSWANFMMDLATIPAYEPHADKSKSKDTQEEIHVSAEDEAEQLMKDLGI